MVCEGQQKAQPASSELEVNAVSASKIRMQTKSPAEEEHVRPRVTFEPLALKDEQSHKAVPQYKRSRELPPRPAPFIRTQTSIARGGSMRDAVCLSAQSFESRFEHSAAQLRRRCEPLHADKTVDDKSDFDANRIPPTTFGLRPSPFARRPSAFGLRPPSSAFPGFDLRLSRSSHAVMGRR